MPHHPLPHDADSRCLFTCCSGRTKKCKQPSCENWRDKKTIELSYSWPNDLWDIDAAYGDVKADNPATFELKPMIAAARASSEQLLGSDCIPPRSKMAIHLPYAVDGETLTVTKLLTQAAMIVEAKVVNNDIPVKTVLWSDIR
ncbi:hypothetical protein H257_00422 [Aphanomyces astaci]|uniref:Uncharacterized protein n=1 Tax=Aphanomyces astaci TaxID=112090 RepID=W4HD11_APHAT|nr:hypothetical protein H257_00422 [Aphanomyces astaci]ETV89018.1 hypothetical protein H257_00422 [Aphanomyces astaci]|eukprot:XP_009821418.1 hypothetical protein H257_00422 [Aphanomyces astaci]